MEKPTDRKDWSMTPPTVNAYYRPPMNDINFPAGILQPPFYGMNMDDAVNYGGIGVVIGHELTHGFDDQGRKYDAQGNLKDWWTPEDAKAFEERASCTADEYSSFVAVKDDKGEVHLNGKLTLGENTADNGGLKLAYMALTNIIGNTPVKPIDGYTPQQRFFLAYGQIWCQNVTDQQARVLAITDPHSPGTLAGEWGGAEFGCVPGGIWLQGRSADGERESLPGLVERSQGHKSSCSCSALMSASRMMAFSSFGCRMVGPWKGTVARLPAAFL